MIINSVYAMLFFNKKDVVVEDNLTIDIKDIKGIKELHLELPITNGIFAFVGENGSGKSALLQSIAQLIRPQNALFSLKSNDYTSTSKINFKGLGYQDSWVVDDNNKWKNEIVVNRKTIKQGCRKSIENNNIKLYGMYEGSLFVGTRFSDSTVVDRLYNNGKITVEKDLVDADTYIIENLSFILHGDMQHYSTLKRLKNKNLREKLGLKNLPYFINSRYGGLISQYRMSSGECLLISLLHFIYNSIIRQSLPTNTPIFMLLDEIELALHPSAVSRFLDLLNDIVKNYQHVSVFLTTHAAEVIKKINPVNIYKLENHNGIVNYINPCYPAYAIRELYSHDRYDYLILCEDVLTKRAIDYILREKHLTNSKLICVCPVGGWENVLRLHMEIVQNNLLGLGTTLISVLDGDIEQECKLKTQYTDLRKIFFPILSIEKCLFNILYKGDNKSLKKKINDCFFTVKSVDTLITEFNKSGTKVDNKKFYSFIKKDLALRKIDENEFIISLLPILFSEISVDDFTTCLGKMLSTQIGDHNKH